MKEMKIVPEGDRALTADFGNEIREDINDRVHLLAEWLQGQKIRGVEELLPTYRSLMVFYDPAQISFGELKERIEECRIQSGGESAGKRTILHVPCCYGGTFGPDLAGMEALTGLTAEEIIRIHSGTAYKIYMLGFLPGFVYLGGLDERIAVPRLESPRTRIPAGSVGIGGNQTGVYPLDSPGGWRLIGSTPLRFYDPDAADPILCRAGEYIRFDPVSPEEYGEIARAVRDGVWHMETEVQEVTPENRDGRSV